MSWAEGRYNARKVFLHNTEVDMTTASGTIIEFPVVLNKIQLIELGVEYTADSGTLSTAGVIALQKVNSSGTTEIGTVTLESSKAQYDDSTTNLDPNANNQLLESAFPEAVRTDVIRFAVKTQGVGGTQTVKPWVIYRELDDSNSIGTP